jgi:hypothetical protein
VSGDQHCGHAQTVDGILFDLDTAEPGPEQARPLKSVREFDAYLPAITGRSPNLGERHRAGEAYVATPFRRHLASTWSSHGLVKVPSLGAESDWGACHETDSSHRGKRTHSRSVG